MSLLEYDQQQLLSYTLKSLIFLALPREHECQSPVHHKSLILKLPALNEKVPEFLGHLFYFSRIVTTIIV